MTNGYFIRSWMFLDNVDARPVEKRTGHREDDSIVLRHVVIHSDRREDYLFIYRFAIIINSGRGEDCRISAWRFAVIIERTILSCIDLCD